MLLYNHKGKQKGELKMKKMIYVVNPESNQIVLESPEEVATLTGIDLEKVQNMKDGEMLTDGSENGSCPAKYEVVASYE